MVWSIQQPMELFKPINSKEGVWKKIRETRNNVLREIKYF